MAYGESDGHVTYVTWVRDPERSSRDLNMLRAQYLENSWRCNL